MAPLAESSTLTTTPAITEPVAATSADVTAPATKIDESPVVAAPASTTTTDAPAAAIAGEPAKDAAADVTAPVTDAAVAPEATDAVKEEPKPIEEGILGYKAPGLIKSFIFSKKHFWFGSEAVETKSLTSYLRGEKPEHANHNASWASHTGKGLWLFSKKHSEKATPHGIINLSAITGEVTTEGVNEFHFLLDGHKHTFQANTTAERDSWVATLKTKIAESKEIAEQVSASEEYKKTHGLLSKPVVAAAAAAGVAPKKAEEKKDEKVATHEAKKEEKAEIKAEKEEVKKSSDHTRKSRSQSRKRQSIFGAMPVFGGSKKEDKVEDKKEETPVTEEPAVIAETTPAAAATTTTETPAVAAATTEEAAPERPVPAKRTSIFGSLKNSFSGHKEKKIEPEAAAPAVPAKDVTTTAAPAEPVSETAPVIPAVETSEPLATSVASPATVPTEVTDATATTGETKTTETPAVKSDKRKSSMPFFGKKDKATSSDEDGEVTNPSPFAKLRATIKGKSSPKAAAATTATKEEKTEDKVADAVVPEVKKDDEVKIADPAVAAAPATTEPVAPATAPVTATA